MRTLQPKVWNFNFFWVAMLSLSYFYCLPLLRTGVVLGITASEIRLYDVIFIVIFFIIILPQTQFFSFWHRLSRAHRFLLYWLIIAFLGLILTVITKGMDRSIIGVIRYIRFFSFASIFTLLFIYVKNREQLLELFSLVLLCIVGISIIGSLQAFGILPNLWPDYYSYYWQAGEGYLSTATLSPNHSHYSMVMAIGIVMVLTRLKINPRINFLNLVYAASLLPMTYSMIACQGRSGWLVLGVYFFYALVFTRKRSVGVIILIMFAAILFNSLSTKTGNTTLRNILLYRAINSNEQLKRTSLGIFDEEDKSLIERFDDNRWAIYVSALGFIVQNPQYLVMGAGFQNASQGIGGVAVAAHNAYLNVTAEHGIIGLTIYLSFLMFLFQMARQRIKNATNKVSYFLASEWIGLFLGLLAANFFAEVIYPGRALFSFLGTFFVITALYLHPAWQRPLTNILVHE